MNEVDNEKKKERKRDAACDGSSTVITRLCHGGRSSDPTCIFSSIWRVTSGMIMK